jgi:putative transposase
MNVGQRRSRSISTLCSLLGYSRQAFYQQRKAADKQVFEDELIIQQVLQIRQSQQKAGTRKLYNMLQPFFVSHKIVIGRDALFELLSRANLLIRKRKRKVPRTTFSNHWFMKHPNLIIGMSVITPNTLWVSDITYITLKDDFAYLSLVTDAYSRKIVGFYLCRDLSAAGCVKALKMAIAQLPGQVELIHHSDRGCQYCSVEYVEQLYQNNVSISMTQNSDPRENAIAERVNGIIKQEFLKASYNEFNEASDAIGKAVKIYNTERLHSSIDMLTPVQAHTRSGELKRHWKNYYHYKKGGRYGTNNV